MLFHAHVWLVNSIMAMIGLPAEDELVLNLSLFYFKFICSTMEKCHFGELKHFLKMREGQKKKTLGMFTNLCGAYFLSMCCMKACCLLYWTFVDAILSL